MSTVPQNTTTCCQQVRPKRLEEMSLLCNNTTRHRVGGANNKRQAQKPSAVSGMLASPSPRFPVCVTQCVSASSFITIPVLCVYLHKNLQSLSKDLTWACYPAPCAPCIRHYFTASSTADSGTCRHLNRRAASRRARSYTIFSTDAPKVPTPAIVNSVVYSLVLFIGGGSRVGPPFPHHSQLNRWPERLGRTGNSGRGNSVWHPSHS
ncbi:hypothetical protein V8C86DRAFT_278680 [Haematococcus lacustris]